VIVQEIIAAVIDSACVTNDVRNIEAALFCKQSVEFVERACARFLVSKIKRTEWEVLAKAPALFVIIDGHRYRRTGIDSLIKRNLVTAPLGRANQKRCGEHVPPVFKKGLCYETPV
jgi:hypothetical protein